MKVATLSRGPRLYRTRGIREVPRAGGHEVRALDRSLRIEATGPCRVAERPPRRCERRRKDGAAAAGSAR